MCIKLISFFCRSYFLEVVSQITILENVTHLFHYTSTHLGTLKKKEKKVPKNFIDFISNGFDVIEVLSRNLK